MNHTNTAPHYNEATQRLLLRFLASVYSHFERELDGIRRTAGEDASHPLFAGKILQAKHALGALKYAAYRVGCRQHHLLEISDDEIERIDKEWQSHSQTLNAGEALPPSACNTTETKVPVTRGNVSANGHAANGRASSRKRSKRR